MIKVYSILFLIVLSCKKTPNNIVKKDTVNKIEIIEIKDSISIKDLKQLPKRKAIEKFGNPSYQEKFVLNDLLGEFRIGLMNIYSKNDRLKENVIIEEITWEKDKNTWITVWYEVGKQKSEPKDVFQWKKGSEF